MPQNLTGRHFLTLFHFSPREVAYLLTLATDLKKAKRMGNETQRLVGKNIALLFEKDSTRTRCAFEVAAADQGAHTTYLGPTGSQMGTKESIADTARVLGRMYDAIEYRGYGQSVVEELAAYARVPVYNGLTNEFHPTQMLADALTMQEHGVRDWQTTTLVYLGDGHNNVAHSLLVLGATLGMDIRVVAPDGLQPHPSVLKGVRERATHTGARVTVTSDVQTGVRGADFLYTDVWVSMGEDPAIWDNRIEALLPYQMNSDLLAATENPSVKVLHCLPAFHDTSTSIGKEIAQRYPSLADGMEITHDVFEANADVIFDQAENRMHTIKAIMVATLA
ncbi:ornithine carbamoyltransferase [Stomatohabitans albus]|uniref:ornithine carbamoyltransferase n=1 Tax=Stomatohabitans albus TaxID=3110766 RepID=UPI00300C2825